LTLEGSKSNALDCWVTRFGMPATINSIKPASQPAIQRFIRLTRYLSQSRTIWSRTASRTACCASTIFAIATCCTRPSYHMAYAASTTAPAPLATRRSMMASMDYGFFVRRSTNKRHSLTLRHLAPTRASDVSSRCVSAAAGIARPICPSIVTIAPSPRLERVPYGVAGSYHTRRRPSLPRRTRQRYSCSMCTSGHAMSRTS